MPAVVILYGVLTFGGMTQKPQTDSAAAPLPSTEAVVHAYRRATPTRKAMMIAGGIAVACTAPYWGPAVWRSKTARRVLGAGAGTVFSRFFA
jgi:hypothetical protein